MASGLERYVGAEDKVGADEFCSGTLQCSSTSDFKMPGSKASCISHLRAMQMCNCIYDQSTWNCTVAYIAVYLG